MGYAGTNRNSDDIRLDGALLMAIYLAAAICPAAAKGDHGSLLDLSNKGFRGFDHCVRVTIEVNDLGCEHSSPYSCPICRHDDLSGAYVLITTIFPNLQAISFARGVFKDAVARGRAIDASIAAIFVGQGKAGEEAQTSTQYKVGESTIDKGALEVAVDLVKQAQCLFTTRFVDVQGDWEKAGIEVRKYGAED